MIEELFTHLGRAVEGAPLIALGAAVAWGILSILLSPCHLASIPLIIGFIDEQGSVSTKRAFTISLLFSVGILITIALIGVVTALAGRMMGDVGKYGNYVVAVIFFVVGLHLLDIIPLKFAGPGQVNMKRKGLPRGLRSRPHFRRGAGPLHVRVHGPDAGDHLQAVGHELAVRRAPAGLRHRNCGVIVVAGTFTEVVQNFLNWNETSKAVGRIKNVCGVLVIFGGIWIIYTAP